MSPPPNESFGMYTAKCGHRTSRVETIVPLPRAPPRGYFFTTTSCEQQQNMCGAVRTQLDAVEIDSVQDKCFFNTVLPVASPEFRNMCGVKQLFVCLLRVDAKGIREKLSDKDGALTQLQETLFDAPWEECLRWWRAFEGGEMDGSDARVKATDGTIRFKVDCDCGGNPSLLSSEELSFQNAAEIAARVERMLAERFEWKLHSHSHPHADPRGTLEVQLFVTEDTFVAGLSVHGSGSHIDHPMPPISETVAMTAAEAQSQSPISAVPELAELHADDKSHKSDVSVESSNDSSCDSPGKPVDKQEEGKRRRAEEKRRKELEKRQKESEKKQAEKDVIARQKEAKREKKQSSKEAKEREEGASVRIYAPQTSTLTEDDIGRAKAKNEREDVRQAQWAYNDAEMTKDELRDYYKSMKSKPKGKTPVKGMRQFADQ